MKKLLIVIISAIFTFTVVLLAHADEKEMSPPPGCCLDLDGDDTTPRARWTRESDGHKIWYYLDEDGNVKREPPKFKQKTGSDILEFNFSDRKVNI